MNFSEAATGIVSQAEYYEIFKSTHFKEHLLTVASDFLKQIQNSSEHWLFLLKSDNLLTGYEQLSY